MRAPANLKTLTAICISASSVKIKGKISRFKELLPSQSAPCLLATSTRWLTRRSALASCLIYLNATTFCRHQDYLQIIAWRRRRHRPLLPHKIFCNLHRSEGIFWNICIEQPTDGNDFDLWSWQSARRDDRHWNGVQLLVSWFAGSHLLWFGRDLKCFLISNRLMQQPAWNWRKTCHQRLKCWLKIRWKLSRSSFGRQYVMCRAWQLKWLSTMRSRPNLAAFVWIWRWYNIWQSTETSCFYSDLLCVS